MERVAIVGAGASGIAAAKEALDHGFEPVVFEASNDIGGLWRYKPEETEEASVMKSTVINTSKEMTAFSTFSPPSEFANFMHNRKMLDYLRLFAASFSLDCHLRLGHAVLDVRRALNFEEDGKWIIHYRTPEGSVHEELFDAVLLCTGHHTQPYLPPEWPGQSLFRGKITHAHSYKDWHGFDDQSVVVVGVGNSGVDIAVELSRVAREVCLVTRRGTWVLHRNLDHSVPFDMALNTRWLHLLGSVVPRSWIAFFFQRMFERRFDHEKFGLKPSHGILSAHLTVNDELPNRLACGTVRVRPAIRQFTASGVLFEDGSVLDPVDHVILATGYSFHFPLLEGGRLIPVQDNQVELYLNMFPPGLCPWNSLAVIGLVQPLGSIMPIAEMQARLFFAAFSGSISLPKREEMMADIGRQREEMERRYVRSRRHTIQVDYLPYMDSLARLLGCLPQLHKYALDDPQLFRALLFGPNAPYVYRLEGPGRWEDAREAILGIDQRVRAGMRGTGLTSEKRDKEKGKGRDRANKGAPLHSSRVPLLVFLVSLLALSLTALWTVSVEGGSES